MNIATVLSPRIIYEPVSFDGRACLEMSISRTNFTPSIRRAGKVFQYMVTGTTMGELKSSSLHVLVSTAAGLGEAAMGDSVSLELGVHGT